MKWSIANQRAVPENIEIERRWRVNIENLPVIRAASSGQVKINQWYPPPSEVELSPENHSIALSGRVMIEGIPESDWKGVCELISSGTGVRIRTMGDLAFLTIKGRWVGAMRAEYEWPVDAGLVRQFGESQGWLGISKTRIYYPLDGDLLCEVDVFSGILAGLVIAEIELTSSEIQLDLPGLPEWLGDEITGVSEWDNYALAKRSHYP
jgi:CYTH domain-containing protein